MKNSKAKEIVQVSIGHSADLVIIEEVGVNFKLKRMIHDDDDTTKYETPAAVDLQALVLEWRTTPPV